MLLLHLQKKIKMKFNVDIEQVATVFVFFIAILLQSTSCTEQSVWHNSSSQPKTKVLDISKRDILNQYYITMPDSAILLSNQMLTQYSDSLTPDDQLFLYSFLAELYQYRKNNNILALENLHQAVRILSMHPELPLNNPYFFVNIGNLLLHNGFHNQALAIYREILQMDNISDNAHAISLINNNIALAFIELNLIDSANYYFNLSANYIRKDDYLILAQNKVLQMELFVLVNMFDSIPKHLRQAKNYIDSYTNSPTNYCTSAQNKMDALYDELRSRIKKITAEQYLLLHEYDSSQVCLQTALRYSKKSGKSMLQSEIYYSLAQVNAQQGKSEQVFCFADSAINIALENKNYKNLIEYTRYLIDYSESIREIDKNKYYRQQYVFFEKALADQKDSDYLLSLQVNMAIGSFDLIIKNIRLLQHKHRQTINRQEIIIWLAIIIVLVISIAFAIFIAQYFKLKRTRTRLAHRSLQVAQQISGSVEKNTDKNKTSRKDNLMQQLENLMKNEKLYLDPNLSLSNLSNKLATNQTYLSQIINQSFNENYNDYINSKRVVYACSLLLKLPELNLTIDHVVEQVGFRSKSTFYNSFKKHTGVSPAAFVKMNK